MKTLDRLMNLFILLFFVLATVYIISHLHDIIGPGRPRPINDSSPSSREAPAQNIGREHTIVEMDVSAYCANACCCGEYADGFTASGKPAAGLICAAPPEYAFGTKFVVEGVTYVCEDRGGAITGNKLDLLFPTHEAALEFGRNDLKVRIVE